MSSDAEASLSLIVARIVYGINWFNISAIFPLIALEFEKDVSLLGSMSAAFFIGVGLFQILWDICFCSILEFPCHRRIIITSSVSSSLWISVLVVTTSLVISFAVVWNGLFFSSAVVLIARHGKGIPCFSIGLMNSAHSMGGIIGIFVWINIAQMIGWRF